MHNQPSTNIWSYWEGPSYPLLDLCRETMLRHNPGARLLDPDSFDALWKYDRDLDFSNRCLAHKADFIRFHLLNEYGGLWVDYDCITLKPLDFFGRALEAAHFIANDEGTGRSYGCNFIAAPAHGYHIADIYRRVVQRLRDPRPLGWLELTDGSVKDIVLRHHEGKGFFKVDRNMIEPVAWCNSREEFFREGTEAEHAARFREAAYTYMLSNNSLGDRVRTMSRDELLHGRFFISYVLRRALGVS